MFFCLYAYLSSYVILQNLCTGNFWHNLEAVQQSNIFTNQFVVSYKLDTQTFKIKTMYA